MGWGCVHFYSNFGSEDRVVRELTRQGYETFCPKYLTPRPTKITENKVLPLFPGYLFVQLMPETQWHAINSTPGVIRLLTHKHGVDSVRPMLLPNDLVDGWRTSRFEALPPMTEVRVRRRDHPFYDRIGTVVGMTKDERISVMMHLFSRDMTIEFADPADLEVMPPQ